MPDAQGKTRVTHWLQYIGLRLCAMVVQSFPINLNLVTARIAGTLLYWLDKRHRLETIGHIQCSFPELQLTDAQRLAKESNQHLFMMGAEILCMPRTMSANSWYHHLEVVNYEKALGLSLGGRGVITVTGHFGNWEMAGYMLAALGIPLNAVYRPLDNPLIDRYLVKLRGQTGQQIIIKFGATQEITRVLQQGHALAFVADQDAGRRGLFVDFFGRKASTYKSIALLALDMDVPIIVGGAYRAGKKFHYILDIVDYIYPEDYPHDMDGALAITARYTRSLEKLIRKAPGQYLWVHRRWKTRPPDEEVPNLETH